LECRIIATLPVIARASPPDATAIVSSTSDLPQSHTAAVLGFTRVQCGHRFAATRTH
jgi:hypothetical protein